MVQQPQVRSMQLSIRQMHSFSVAIRKGDQSCLYSCERDNGIHGQFCLLPPSLPPSVITQCKTVDLH